MIKNRSVIDDFVGRFNCRLTVSENSEHPFMKESDKTIVEAWMNNSI